MDKKAMSPILVDFETFYSKKGKYSIKGNIPEHYCADERFHPYLVSVCDGSESWCGELNDMTWSSLHGRFLAAHNARFDKTVFEEAQRRGWIPRDIKPAGWICTANMTSYLCNQRALDNAVEVLFGQKISKEARTNAEGKRWPHDFPLDQRDQMIKYAEQDSVWGWRLWEKYNAAWPELERRLSAQTINQGMRGLQINTDLLDEYLLAAHDALMATKRIIPWMPEFTLDDYDDEDFDEEENDWSMFKVKPTAMKCIAEQCARSGIPTMPVKSDDPEEFEEWENTYAPKHPWVKAVSAYRAINKFLKTVQLIKIRLRADDTLPFSLKYFGGHTGRWSGDARLNLQNQRKLPLLLDSKMLMIQDPARIAEYEAHKEGKADRPSWLHMELDVRRLIIPRPGKKMILCDLAAIEPRVLAWLCGNFDLLDKIAGGMSVYEAFARTNMGYTGGKMDKSSLYYKMTKIQVLGLGYGAGWKKFISICANGGVDITANDPEFVEYRHPITDEPVKESGYGTESKKVVNDFRAANKKITGLWQDMDDRFKQCIGRNFTVELPSGRKMIYRNVSSSKKIETDPETKEIKTKWVFKADTGERTRIFYGGKIVENVTQAVARDVFATHLVSLEDTYGDDTVLFTSHDEAIGEYDQSVTPADVERTMSVCPDWLEGCPIAAEAKEVLHYQK